jgi:hypothetical protein
MVSTLGTPSKVSSISIFFSKSLVVRSNYTPRTTKVPNAAMLGWMDKHKAKGKQGTIIFGCCDSFIDLGSLLT